jgi:maleylpyruvate isomerase
MPVPTHDLARVSDAHRRLLDAISDLTEAQVRAPSLLPDWTVAHVLSHLARNADSHVRRAEAANRGEVVDQYLGGAAGRSQQIEDGAVRPAADLLEDVHRSAVAAEDAWRMVADVAWRGRSRDANGLARPLFELPGRRWQEIEVHLVDLSIGVTHRDWPDDFVLEWLPRTRERMAGALLKVPDPGLTEPSDELAWLYGRLSGNGLPEVPRWG